MGKRVRYLKYCGIIPAYGKVPYIDKTIKSLGDLPIYIFNTDKSWWSDDHKDYVADKIKKYKDRVTLVRGKWRSQAELLNEARIFTKVRDYDIMILLDSDEAIEGLDNLIDFIERRYILHQEIDTCMAPLIEYAPNGKDILPQRGHMPIIAVRTSDSKHKFTSVRNYNGGLREVKNVKIYHYSFMNKEEYKYKVGTKYTDKWPPKEYRDLI